MILKSDAVVIGGGVTGASVTYHLASVGLTVICIEKNSPASGATGKSSAIIRMHHDNLPEMEMAFASLPYFQNWKDIVGVGDCDFRVTGCLRFVDPRDYEKLRSNVSLMKELGVNTELICRNEINQIAPTFFTEDVEIAAWEPEAGYADPCGTTYGFLSAAEEKGAKLLCPAFVTGIRIEKGRISGVETDKCLISTRIVVNAAGAFANKIADMCGFKLPVSPIRYQAGIFRRPLEVEVPHPTIIDRLSGQFYFRPDVTGHTLVGGIGARRVKDPENNNEITDPGYSKIATEMLSKRMPGMERAIFRGGRSGCDGISEDAYAIIDKISEVKGCYCAAGHSGHGFKIAPAVGLSMAELITEGRSSTIDISPFGLSRFKEVINPFDNPNRYDERGQ